MPICNLEAADVLLRIYPQDYAYIQEPAFGGDLLVSIVSLNNEDNISLKDWINTYCPEDWVRKSIGPLKVKQGEATRSYSRQNGKKMFIGHNYGGSMYFIYGFSSKTETIAEELFAEMLNTFQTPD